MAAANYFSPVSKLIWSMSAIEALLLDPSETGSKTLLENRLRAILDPYDSSSTIGIFRKLYTLRSEILHGARDVQIWIGNDIYPETNSSKAIQWPLEDADTAYAIAVGILQMFILRNKKTISFRTSAE